MTAFDDTLARKVDEYAWAAEQAHRRGRPDEASKLYAKAAALEQQAAQSQWDGPVKVRSVLAVSAVALWYKAARWKEMERLAYRWLAECEGLTVSAHAELRDLLQRAWVESQVEPAALEQTLPIELRLVGGEVRQGLAPAKLVRRTQERFVALLERIGEWKLEVPYRESGVSRLAKDIEVLQAPARAASYGIRLYLRSTIASERGEVSTAELVTDFFRLAQLDTKTWENIDDRYQRSFLEHLRDLSADGDQVADIVYSSPTWRLRVPELHLDPTRRAQAQKILKDREALRWIEEQLEGLLTGVSLAAQRPWVELSVGAGQSQRLELDDAIQGWSTKLGPLLERRVRVQLRHEDAKQTVIDVGLAAAADETSYGSHARSQQSRLAAEDSDE